MKYILIETAGTSDNNSLYLFTFVILLVMLIGLLSREPPEIPNQSFNTTTHTKTNFITIGGQTTQQSV